MPDCNDGAHLFIKKSFGIKFGVAYIGGICQHPFNCGVDVFEDNHLYAFTFTVSHELGHNLGIQHDTEWCVCELEWYIMFPSKQVTTKFSNCSYAQFWGSTFRMITHVFSLIHILGIFLGCSIM